MCAHALRSILTVTVLTVCSTGGHSDIYRVRMIRWFDACLHFLASMTHPTARAVCKHGHWQAAAAAAAAAAASQPEHRVEARSQTHHHDDGTCITSMARASDGCMLQVPLPSTHNRPVVGWLADHHCLERPGPATGPACNALLSTWSCDRQVIFTSWRRRGQRAWLRGLRPCRRPVGGRGHRGGGRRP